MASKLILTLDGEIIKEYTLDNNSLSIGRKHENDIQLNDLTISGRHAIIANNNGTTYVEDLGSTNGTLVNGNHISKVTLQHGNVVQIGHHLFSYMSNESEQYEPTMFVKAELDETQIVLPEWEENAKASNLRGQLLGGLRKIDDVGGTSCIEMRKPFSTIGYQGKKLAMDNRGPSGYTIVGIKAVDNRRSTDVPLLNGEIIGPVAMKLKERDVISIAGIEMEFYYIQ